MTAPTKLGLKIYQGSTFTQVLRWESYTKIYKPITGITQTAPVVITSVAHGITVGWRAKVSNVVGMKELNSSEYYTVTNVTADTVTLNDINAVGYTAYTSGGILEYNEPEPLAGRTARMQIRPKVGSDIVLLELTTENGMININDANKIITITIPATTTELLTFKSAVYSMEIVNGSVVTPFIYGNITLDTEITRYRVQLPSSWLIVQQLLLLRHMRY
jgi:hypothetical protein